MPTFTDVVATIATNAQPPLAIASGVLQAHYGGTSTPAFNGQINEAGFPAKLKAAGAHILMYPAVETTDFLNPVAFQNAVNMSGSPTQLTPLYTGTTSSGTPPTTTKLTDSLASPTGWTSNSFAGCWVQIGSGALSTFALIATNSGGGGELQNQLTLKTPTVPAGYPTFSTAWCKLAALTTPYATGASTPSGGVSYTIWPPPAQAIPWILSSIGFQVSNGGSPSAWLSTIQAVNTAGGSCDGLYMLPALTDAVWLAGPPAVTQNPPSTPYMLYSNILRYLNGYSNTASPATAVDTTITPQSQWTSGGVGAGKVKYFLIGVHPEINGYFPFSYFPFNAPQALQPYPSSNPANQSLLAQYLAGTLTITQAMTADPTQYATNLCGGGSLGIDGAGNGLINALKSVAAANSDTIYVGARVLIDDGTFVGNNGYTGNALWNITALPIYAAASGSNRPDFLQFALFPVNSGIESDQWLLQTYVPTLPRSLTRLRTKIKTNGITVGAFSGSTMELWCVEVGIYASGIPNKTNCNLIGALWIADALCMLPEYGVTSSICALSHSNTVQGGNNGPHLYGDQDYGDAGFWSDTKANITGLATSTPYPTAQAETLIHGTFQGSGDTLLNVTLAGEQVTEYAANVGTRLSVHALQKSGTGKLAVALINRDPLARLTVSLNLTGGAISPSTAANGVTVYSYGPGEAGNLAAPTQSTLTYSPGLPVEVPPYTIMVLMFS